MIQVESIKSSSTIKRIGYDHTKSKMFVEFVNGGVYQYNDVPPAVFFDMLESPSKGSYMHKAVKGKFQTEKMTTPPQEFMLSPDKILIMELREQLASANVRNANMSGLLRSIIFRNEDLKTDTTGIYPEGYFKLAWLDLLKGVKEVCEADKLFKLSDYFEADTILAFRNGTAPIPTFNNAADAAQKGDSDE